MTPVDQRLCTTALCEVRDAAQIGGVEDVHVVKNDSAYDPSDGSTFTHAGLSGFDGIVSGNENNRQVFKAYPPTLAHPLRRSFLHNDTVGISLIGTATASRPLPS